MRERLIRHLAWAMMSWVLLGAVRLEAATVSGDLKIYVLNVGQGDAILIVCPHGTHRMLIDSGDRKGSYAGSEAAFKKQMLALLPANDRSLDVVVATHPHSDHIGNMLWVLETFRIRKFIDSGREYTTNNYKTVRNKAAALENDGKLEYYHAHEQTTVSLLADFCPASNLSARLLRPSKLGPPAKIKEINNTSVTVLVKYNSVKLAFTGDSEHETEEALIEDSKTRKWLRGAQVYKVGHHGSDTSSIEDLLNLMSPQWALISNGCDRKPNDGYRHPRAVIVRRLDDRIGKASGKNPRKILAGEVTDAWHVETIHAGTYSTAIDDAILLLTDGATIRLGNAGLANPDLVCKPTS